MLSDEEKTALEFIKINNKHKYCDKDDVDFLLNLIEKQQKEIERLEARKYMLNAETGEISQIPIDNNYISKDKIKEKILECRKILYSFEKELELKANKEKYIHKESMNCLLSQISILQSLLEKE